MPRRNNDNKPPRRTHRGDRGVAPVNVPAATTPERTCIVCRQPRATLELVRLACTGGIVTPAVKGTGRGAWVCASSGCLEKVSAPVLARAFKHPVASFSSDELFLQLELLAQRRVLEMIGLARRSHALRVGVDEIRPDAGDSGFVVLASDASERVCMQLPRGRTFVPSGELSKAAGLYNVYALSINPGPLALQAAYWLSMWYECRSRNRRMDGSGA